MVKNKNNELIDNTKELKIGMRKGLALNNKFFPVHCVVTREESPQRVLQDGFVIIPSQTKFHDIISVILKKLEVEIGKIGANERVDGEILIKNWNPLPIESVTEKRTVTVHEVLGDLMNIAVLQIHISKYSNSSDDRSSKEIFPAGSSYDNSNRIEYEESDEDEQSTNGYSSNSNTNDGENGPLNLSKKSSSSLRSNANHSSSSLSTLVQNHQQHQRCQQSQNHRQQQQQQVIVSDSNLNNRRQRERTTFDPQEETPRLLQIFTDTKHPTRYQIASICETLNALPCRKGKKALEPYNIQYWFKNARAALKRKKRPCLSSESQSNQDSTSKCDELDSSEEIDDEIDEDREDEEILDENRQDQSNDPKKNYYFNYLKAFDISLTDQQQKLENQMSDESNEDDNGSVSSERSPPTQILTTVGPSKIGTFEYNRSRRNRIFIDPASEVPKLEQWFAIETHPDHILIERICSELNEGEYRTKFPRLESKHIRLWFKNHRAKVKRLGRIHSTNDKRNSAVIEQNDDPREN